MRRIRIGRRRPLFEVLGKSQLYDLLHGRGWHGDEWGPRVCPVENRSEAAWEEWNINRRRAWAMHRDTLIAAWIAEHPGTRPHAFWSYDAPDRLEGETERAYLSRQGPKTAGERGSLEQSEQVDTLTVGESDHGEA